MTKTLVLGGVSYNTLIYLDTFAQLNQATVFSTHCHETVGSTGAGKALNLHRLGLEVTLHGLIGEDSYGHWICDHLHKAGLQFLYDVDPLGTKRHVNLMDAQGERISIFIASGAFDPEVDYERLETHIQANDIIVVNIINYCRALLPAIRAAGRPIWCDIHDYDGQEAYHRDFIAAADYIFMSSANLPEYRNFMETLMATGKRMIVCTHGRQGATALTPDGEWIEVPIIDTYKRVDTNGAGDSFFAGFFYGHHSGYDVKRCLRLGAIAAGMCITSYELASPDLSAQSIEQAYAQHFPTVTR
ncbi:MAG: carbohydrate kinase family protein [Anaerolineae bacterium]|nr:carbohydrate kinase family protein [Anaerolineae bacterium]